MIALSSGHNRLSESALKSGFLWKRKKLSKQGKGKLRPHRVKKSPIHATHYKVASKIASQSISSNYDVKKKQVPTRP
jgi:hypothetical protein